ncbi:MAG: hypothetical protein OEV44_01845 [Spirochaetota bacterium]|nr:hypothetical protein [Spirochaetota bacterium]
MDATLTVHGRQEIIPNIGLDMEHRVILTNHQKGLLLEERQHIINESIATIQSSFFRIGKALAEIRKFKLYKADPLYPSWREFINHRIVPKLHQSTITDYIGIVKMQLENQDYIKEEDLVRLGYKKVKLLKAKLNLIQKEKDSILKRKLENKFKSVYERSFKEFRDLPYSTYEYLLSFVQSAKKENNYILEKEDSNFVYRLDKKRLKISITPKTRNVEKLTFFFNRITSLE